MNIASKEKLLSTPFLSFPLSNWMDKKSFKFFLYFEKKIQAFEQIQLLIRWKYGDDWCGDPTHCGPPAEHKDEMNNNPGFIINPPGTILI